jgi:hypothetical protein
MHAIPSHPVEDAKLAYRWGDISLRGLAGFAVDVPGQQIDYEIIKNRFKVVIIEKTSDVYVVDDSYNDEGRRYAEIYNREMLTILGCRLDNQMDKCSNFAK